jgi:dual-specificity kinase
MSTPSIATQVLPAHQSQYSFTYQNPYSTSSRAYPTNNSLPAPPRLTTSYQPYPSIPQYSRPPISPVSYKQPSQTSSLAPSYAASDMANPPRKQPNWNEFYKNGVPKEIIVIDDDSPPPQQSTRTNAPRNQQDAQSYSAYNGRKRKLDHGYDADYNDSPTYSTHPAKFGASSSSASYHSGDRTTSLQTVTAPTSLESYGSNAASNSYEDVRTIGQKRKRVQPQKETRAQETRAQTKKKQQESASDAYADYVPPPKPLRKAGEVAVPVIRDTLHKHHKVDDEDGHYIVQQNTVMTDRYDIIKLLGQGTFGKVVEAYDKRKKTKCAVKIIRSVQKYRDASKIELRVLSTLALNDKNNRNKCIHLRDSFDFRNHICIVTDLLGQSVFDFLKGNGFVPFPSSQIQNFARQLLTSVACKSFHPRSNNIPLTSNSSSRSEPYPHRSETGKYLVGSQCLSDIHLQPDDTIVITHLFQSCTSTTCTIGQ